MRRAIGIDARVVDLDLGLVDGFVMAIAEQMRAPILTFAPAVCDAGAGCGTQGAGRIARRRDHRNSGAIAG